jgi:hypothetical protein
LTDLIDVVLTEHIDEVVKNPLTRDTLLELVAILVKRQAPVALALQERVKAKLTSRQSG